MAGSCNSSSFLSVGNDLIFEPSGQEREDEVTDFYFLVRKLVAALHYRTDGTGGALCVRLDFAGTFQTNTMCNNINYV